MPFLKSIIAFLFTGILVLSACESKKEGGPRGGQNQRQRGPISAEAFVASISTISEDIEVPGSLLPLEETQVRSEVNGRIIQLNIPEGTVVPKGFLLVKLFDQDQQAQLRKLRVQLQIAIKTVQRQKELLSINGISQQDYDLSALNVDNLKADIQSTEIAISKTEIRAPYEGQIGLRNVSTGSFLSSSDVITTLRDIRQLKLEFSVPEKYAKNIFKGSRVSFRVDGGQADHEATVMATEGNVEPTTRTLKVRALVTNKHPELVPGIFARVHLELGKDNKAIMIPTQSVIPLARNKRVIIFHKDSAAFQTVETGIRDSTYVQILKGVKAGDTIITTGLMAIRPGSKVIISSVKEKN
ncbi:MAG: efflux RND transporter periplasmic adaptor subunit [Cyclobacteriaceae bacterium]|nr:efflux RND transporter periplasmic adaptor subunit [Cyclobacteriaceae bacterium]